MGCWKLNVGPLEEQVALLTTEQLPKAGFTNQTLGIVLPSQSRMWTGTGRGKEGDGSSVCKFRDGERRSEGG